MKKEYILLIDFDSTFVTVESLDQLAQIVLKERKNKQEILNQIIEITRQGMEGTITFPDSLARRLELFKPNKKHLKELVRLLHTAITPSFEENKGFFHENADRIYILSGGFKEYMIPVLKEFGILEENILGNTLLFNKKGQVVGHDVDNPLAKEKGKVKMVQQMAFKNPIIMIGDGYTDYEVKDAGLAEKFIAYTGNVAREAVVKNADIVARNFKEVMKNL